MIHTIIVAGVLAVVAQPPILAEGSLSHSAIVGGVVAVAIVIVLQNLGKKK
jgi:hypothetical protein